MHGNPNIKALLEAVANGKLTTEKALEQLKRFPFQVLGEGKVDHHRALRRGVPEIIYGAGKDVETLMTIIQGYRDDGLPLLITKVPPPTAEPLLEEFPDLIHNKTASTLRWSTFRPEWTHSGTIAVVGAGLSDGPIVAEVTETLTFLSSPHEVLTDAGVAGMHRFLNSWDLLSKAPVIVAVAGMEGALPSVLAGLFPGPVIGVPTSVGYGTHLGGLTPLLGMLNSCTAGVAVVNVDNGVAAGYIATLINRTS